MRFVIAFILLALSITCLGADEYPVKWTDQLQIKSIADINKEMNGRVGSVKLINDKNAHKIAQTCNEYTKLTKSGYYPENNAEIAAESFFKQKCEPLTVLLKARPAKISYIRDFNLQKDYGLLPAAIIFPSLGESAGPAGAVKTVYPDTQVKEATSNTITLISKQAGMETHASILAWGDFDHNGYDDMMVFVVNYVIGGTYHSYTVYLLTRTKVHSPIITIS